MVQVNKKVREKEPSISVDQAFDITGLKKAEDRMEALDKWQYLLNLSVVMGSAVEIRILG